MMKDKKTNMEYRLFKMLDTLIEDMSQRITVKNEYPVDGKLFEQANVLLDQYAIHKIQENDIGFTRKSTLDPLI
tara:strand:+ start:2961 stop:3182 length:222 start_codon:yes stop_codon:yes gene_type:complete